jgi:2,3-bisphosphoglycerate-independent phosphoglycerate mutase
MLEAVGIDFNIEAGDVAARGNFCTVDEGSLVTDRRAGRISNEKCAELSHLLDSIVIPDTSLFVRPVREHRFVVVFRGEELNPDVNDSDPQQTGVVPEIIRALKPEASKMAKVANEFMVQAGKVLAHHHPANMVLLRGFSQYPQFPTMNQIYKLKPAAIASYPMYRGLARLVGMETLETGTSPEDEFSVLKQNYTTYDFFFLHIKGTDSTGEDGDFARKVKVIEEFDAALSGLSDIKPDVIIVTGDHSTPAILKGHSWHPVPVLLYSRWCRPDKVSDFSEPSCMSGGLGRFPATQLMSLAMAHALKLNKFGA